MCLVNYLNKLYVFKYQITEVLLISEFLFNAKAKTLKLFKMGLFTISVSHMIVM